MKRISKNKNHNARSFGSMLIPVTFILAGAVFMLAGFFRGEVDVVLRKAINICLECIGIG